MSRKHIPPPISDEFALESKARVIAMADGLDEFICWQWCWPGSLEYTTLHGERRINVNDPCKCQFEVTRSSDGFAEAVLLPYTVPYIVSDYSNDYPKGALIVYTTEGGEEVTRAGYAVAVKLPYFVVSKSDEYAFAAQLPYFVSFESDEYPVGALIVDVSPWHTEALAAGYHNAIALKCPLPEEIYIEDLGMLDTEYAALLAQQEAEEDSVEPQANDVTDLCSVEVRGTNLIEVNPVGANVSQSNQSEAAHDNWNRVYELEILIPYFREDFRQRQEASTPERELFLKWQMELQQLTGANIDDFTSR